MLYAESPSRFKDFTDNHMHVDPINGDGIKAVKRFHDAGGRFVFLVCKTTGDCNIPLNDEKSFEKLYDFTIRLSDEINRRADVKSFPVIGVHPAEFAAMCKKFSVEKALEIGRKAVDAAGARISAGRAVALGEIGRPHFAVSEEVLNACNELMEHVFSVAGELDCAVQLHTERISEGNFAEFRKLAVSSGLKPGRVIKHFSPPLIKAAEKQGIYPSLIASKKNISRAIKEGNRFLIESDYIDDAGRPNAVVGPESSPMVSIQLAANGVLTDEDLWQIHRENVERAYGFNLDYFF